MIFKRYFVVYKDNEDDQFYSISGPFTRRFAKNISDYLLEGFFVPANIAAHFLEGKGHYTYIYKEILT